MNSNPQTESFNPLPSEFYTRRDVVQIARDLLGMVLCTSFNNEITSGIIVETEAYEGITDMASHAYNGRRTPRTEIMYREGGSAYVYLCYGIHSLFNIVTSVEGDPHAVLIRGILPLTGIEVMKQRMAKPVIMPKNGIGPGNVSRLLGIQVAHTGLKLCGEPEGYNRIWVRDNGGYPADSEIIISRRIGIDYAGEDAKLPYRFQLVKNKAPF